MKNKNRVHVIFGGQAGSEAKGKVAGFLALSGDYDVAVANFMPNAGHTWIGETGTKVMVQTLPQASITHLKENSNVHPMELMLSAGQAIELKLLIKEIINYKLDPKLITIDNRAVIVQQHHKDKEAQTMGRISSTLKGCGEALAGKVTRSSDTILWRDIFQPKIMKRLVESEGLTKEDMAVLTDINTEMVSKELWNRINEGCSILVEAPQGFDLDVNHGVQFPYCTSRQTTPAQAIADAGIAPQMVDRITAVIRPYPIRVGDNYNGSEMIGTSGDYPSAELTWEDVAERSGMPREEITEFTTVTGKLRRVFELNMHRLTHMVRVTGTTDIALNFANYIDYNVQGATDVDQLSDKVIAFIRNIEISTGVKVSYVGTGAKENEAIDLMHPTQESKYAMRLRRLSFI